ncbi:hypothetical protein L1283_004209 [Sphingobacterium sp. HSC-15S19]
MKTIKKNSLALLAVIFTLVGISKIDLVKEVDLLVFCGVWFIKVLIILMLNQCQMRNPNQHPQTISKI